MPRSPLAALAALSVVCLTAPATCQEPPGMLATSKHLFVVRGDWLYQFDVGTLQLLHKVRLDGDGKAARRAVLTPEPKAEAAGGGVEAPDNRKPKAPAATGNAVDLGLQWLARHQDDDGRWDADGFMKHDHADEKPSDGPGNPVHDVAATGLAMLAMLGSGNTLRSGPYRDNLKKAARWLREQQQPNGLYCKPAAHDYIYDHAIATYAMCEAYGLSNYALLKSSVQRALNYLETHRNPYAVWRYQPRDNDNDTSVTTWCLLALKSGEHFGLEVNPTALELGAVWLDQVTTPDGRVGYTKAGERSSRMPGDHGSRFPVEQCETLTAAGLLCRFMLGQNPKQKAVMNASARLLLDKPLDWDEQAGTIDHYYWFFGTHAMFQMGGRYWQVWSQRLRSEVVDEQRRDESFAGSWDPVGVWGENGGRVYSTALMTLALESYCRYARLVR